MNDAIGPHTNAAAADGPCHRNNPHYPHGGCPGTAPEFPWERIEIVEEAEHTWHGNCAIGAPCRGSL